MTYYFELVLRSLFGLQMLFWGLNGFFHWMPTPPPSATFERFVQACHDVKFLMPTVKILEIICGVFLLIGFVVPASLLLLAPVMFVIAGLHIFLNPKPWGVLAMCTLPYLILLSIYGATLLRVIH